MRRARPHCYRPQASRRDVRLLSRTVSGLMPISRGRGSGQPWSAALFALLYGPRKLSPLAPAADTARKGDPDAGPPASPIRKIRTPAPKGLPRIKARLAENNLTPVRVTTAGADGWFSRCSCARRAGSVLGMMEMRDSRARQHRAGRAAGAVDHGGNDPHVSQWATTCRPSRPAATPSRRSVRIICVRK